MDDLHVVAVADERREDVEVGGPEGGVEAVVGFRGGQGGVGLQGAGMGRVAGVGARARVAPAVSTSLSLPLTPTRPAAWPLSDSLPRPPRPRARRAGRPGRRGRRPAGRARPGAGGAGEGAPTLWTAWTVTARGREQSVAPAPSPGRPPMGGAALRAGDRSGGGRGQSAGVAGAWRSGECELRGATAADGARVVGRSRQPPRAAASVSLDRA